MSATPYSGPVRRAVIIGAGIGGLTAALCLARVGYRVLVVEQAQALGEVGAGLQISPNAARVLCDLGLEDALDGVAFRPEAVEARNWKRGTVLSRTELGAKAVARYGAPYLHLHRADLIAVLAAAVDLEPAIELRLGTLCFGCETTSNGASVDLETGRVSADLVIGADGIRSVVREGLFGAAQPRFTGNIAWRGLIPAQIAREVGAPPVAGLWMGPGAHLVHYYVRGGRMLNVVGVVQRDDWREESWTARGDPEQLLADYAGWHPRVRALIAALANETCFRWALFDRDPLSRWSAGAATLLGDACHPTLPFMAQGACMAIEDAAVLAGCVARAAPGRIAEGLSRYEGLRRQRTAGIQSASRRNMFIYHMREPLSWARDLSMRAGGGMQSVMNGLYSYDALEVARKAAATS